MTKQRIDMPIATGVSASLSDDGNHVGLSFRHRDGLVNIGFPARNLSHMIAHLIGVAEDIASRHVREIRKQETITALPIPVSAIALQPGRVDSEALMSVRTGPMDLVFAVDLQILRDTYEQLVRDTVRKPGERKSH